MTKSFSYSRYSLILGFETEYLESRLQQGEHTKEA